MKREALEKNREYMRRYRQEAKAGLRTPKPRKPYSNVRHLNPMVEFGARMPQALIREIRVRTLIRGGDPGVPAELALTCSDIAMERPELMESWLYFPTLVYRTKNWATRWRRFSDETRQQHIDEAEQIKTQVG